jgi:hypothetical protein
LKNNNVWIGDSGFTSHMTNHLEGLSQHIIMGNGKKLLATKNVKLTVSTIDTDGQELCCAMSYSKFVGDLWRKLISLSAVLKIGAKIVSDGSNLGISKDKLSFKFKEIESGGLKAEVDAAFVTSLPQVKVEMNVFHRRH